MNPKRTYLLALLLLVSATAWAQQEPLYSQYAWNKLLLNPAYAGARAQLSGDFLMRRQWAGFDGAPRNEAASIHFPTPDLRHGFGMTLQNDRQGFQSQTVVAGHYAFRIPMGEAGSLAFGLKAGIRSYRLQNRDIALWDANDGAFGVGNNFAKGFMVVAPGVYFQNERFYAGLSVSDLLPHRLYEPTLSSVGGRTRMHTYAMAGAALPLGEAVSLRPALLLRAVPGAPLGMDLTLAAAFVDRVTVGASWRPRNAMVFLLQAYATKFIRIGYAYDLGVNATRMLATGGHEFSLGFDLNFLQESIDRPKPF